MDKLALVVSLTLSTILSTQVISGQDFHLGRDDSLMPGVRRYRERSVTPTRPPFVDTPIFFPGFEGPGRRSEGLPGEVSLPNESGTSSGGALAAAQSSSSSATPSGVQIESRPLECVCNTTATMNKYFPGVGRIEYRPDAGPEDTLVYRHYNAGETVHGRTMEEWFKFSACYFNTFRYLGSDDYYGDATHQRSWEDGSRSLDNFKRRMIAAFEFFHKLNIKYYSISDRDMAPEGESFDETNAYLEEMVTLCCDLQKQTGIKPLYYSADLFTHPRYMNGAGSNPDAHVFAYACAQVKRSMEAAKRMGAENFVFFNPRDGYQSVLQRQFFRDMSHMAQLYKMAIQYKEKIGYKGQFLIQPKPHDPRRHQYESDAMATMHMLRHFGLDKHFKLYVKPAFSRMMGRPYEHDVYMAAAYNMLGSVDASDSFPEVNGTSDICADNMRDATHVMKCVLEQGGMQQGGFTLGFRVRRESVEPRDLFHGAILTMDTFARALRNAARILADGCFTRSIQQRYASYKSGFGEKVEKNAVTFEECEDYVRKTGEPQAQSSRHEHYENMFNYYVYPPRQ